MKDSEDKFQNNKNKTLEENNLSKEKLLNQAFRFHSKGDISEASKHYQIFIKKGFSDARVFLNYGIILQQLGKLEDAEMFTRKAIAINPKYALAYLNLGNILKDIGKLSDAEIYTLKAIEINPNFTEAYSNLGTILMDFRKFKEAEVYTNKAIKLNPNSAGAYLNLGAIMKGIGNFKKAEIHTRKAIKLKPNLAISYSNLGSILKELGRLEEASNALQKALELNPNLLEAKVNLEDISQKKVPRWHIPMINDNLRNEKYFEAIKKAINKNEYVLEIGTGSGLLSMMAIDAGAKKVITCENNQSISEIAKKIIIKNGYQSQINVINKSSTSLDVGEDLSQKADLIISEIFSSELVGEGIQPSILDAKNRLLKDNGKMIPESAEIKIAVLESSSETRNKCFIGKINKYELSDFNQITGNKFSLDLQNMDINFLSNEKIAFSFDFYSNDITKQKNKILSIPINKDGTCLGIVTWMKINLYQGVYLENNPTNKQNSHWTNLIYRFDEPLKVSKGINLKIKASLMADSIWFELI